MPVLPLVRVETAGEVPFKPLRSVMECTGARQSGSVGVGVRVGVDVLVLEVERVAVGPQLGAAEGN